MSKACAVLGCPVVKMGGQQVVCSGAWASATSPEDGKKKRGPGAGRTQASGPITHAPFLGTGEGACQNPQPLRGRAEERRERGGHARERSGEVERIAVAEGRLRPRTDEERAPAEAETLTASPGPVHAASAASSGGTAKPGPHTVSQLLPGSCSRAVQQLSSGSWTSTPRKRLHQPRMRVKAMRRNCGFHRTAAPPTPQRTGRRRRPRAPAPPAPPRASPGGA